MLNQFKILLVDKFAEIYKILQDLCSCVQRAGASITASALMSIFYEVECIEKKFLSFIRSHRPLVMIWIHLNSCHHSNLRMKNYEVRDSDINPKNLNPLNTPEFHQIELY